MPAVSLSTRGCVDFYLAVLALLNCLLACLCSRPAHCRQVFPWVKLIASMREPISRGISMLAHNLDKSSIGCLTR